MLFAMQNAFRMKNRIPQYSQIAHYFGLNSLGLDPFRTSEPRTNPIFPVRVQKYQYCLCELLFIAAAFRICGDVIAGSDYPVVDYIGPRGILVAGSDDYLLTAVINSRAHCLIDTSNLTFDPNLMTSESTESVHVDTNLLVHELDVFANHIIEGFGHCAPFDLVRMPNYHN